MPFYIYYYIILDDPENNLRFFKAMCSLTYLHKQSKLIIMVIYIIKQAFYNKTEKNAKQELKWKNLYAESTEEKAKKEVQKLEIESIREFRGNKFRFTYDYEAIMVY